MKKLFLWVMVVLGWGGNDFLFVPAENFGLETGLGGRFRREWF